MKRSLTRTICTISFALGFFLYPPMIHGQASSDDRRPSIAGKVCDAQDHPLAGVKVSLDNAELGAPVTATTDSLGHFEFFQLVAGTYTLHALLPGFSGAAQGPFALNAHERKSFLLRLQTASSAESSKNSSADIPFSDETHFTVAGVTDSTSFGGHGSDPVRRNSDVLSKDTALLSSASSGTPGEATIRDQLSKTDNAELRFQLAEIEENSGRSLDAVNDYQRAAQMDPSEPHLFAWGAELLLHRAFDPAIEVFSKARNLYPKSVRMVLGLGSATYALGSTDEAKQIFLEACDIAPSDPTPYLFLGRVQVTEGSLPAGWTDRLKRFAELYPENAMAHFFYAAALAKKPAGPEEWPIVEAQLKTAVALDPHLSDAYLQLGILASQQGDFPKAIGYLQNAVANTPFPDDAHYRLAQVYRRMGETEKAMRETELYKQASQKKKQQVEQERHELQQFVYTLREQKASAPNQTPEK
jgi:tetratricopeptide (TPR) repeat protein